MAANHLEYEEGDEDLFGDTDLLGFSSVNPSAPINLAPPAVAGPSSNPLSPNRPVRQQEKPREHLYPHIVSGARSTRTNEDERLAELRDRKRAGREQAPRKGVKSLRLISMNVIQQNSSGIWDIGDMEYSVLRPFLDEVGAEQLAEIERNSPHIKKDTDWLWEVLLLQDYRLFHERCRINREGEVRTSGWRKMYKRAKEDALERQSQAADRVAARYKQLEQEKKSKSIVVLDKVMPGKKPTRSRGRGGSSVGSTSSRPSAAATSIAKARAEAQRARIALTHASGRYVPPTQTLTQAQRVSQSQLFKNPYMSGRPTPSGSERQAQPATVRIPAPRRVAKSAAVASRPRDVIASPPSSPIPGSFPSSQYPQVRASLPSHLSSQPSPASPQSSERFRIDSKTLGTKKTFKEIKKPEVRSFEPPVLEKEKPKQKTDFFGGAASSADGGGIFRVKKRKPGVVGGASGPPAKRPAPGK
ncbi:elongin-A [Cryptococcus wingfieldii CBS 7118]|uniref:Elongin-A n=1 Tax=Cryptococcus wingfieldii CBS 7118 TaxID=1295528 RepID=A0A1E3IFD2_9TREE|nr:elongin-A [Cryptococcus wingfieldii CBS 7118]ODN87135.1 elongin-A [Cryptococcus wingfieldii CBS 7118]